MVKPLSKWVRGQRLKPCLDYSFEGRVGIGMAMDYLKKKKEIKEKTNSLQRTIKNWGARHDEDPSNYYT